MSDTHSITQYGLTNTQARTYLMYHAIDNKTDHAIRDIQTAIDTLKQGASAQTALWHRCRQLDVSATPPPRSASTCCTIHFCYATSPSTVVPRFMSLAN